MSYNLESIVSQEIIDENAIIGKWYDDWSNSLLDYLFARNLHHHVLSSAEKMAPKVPEGKHPESLDWYVKDAMVMRMISVQLGPIHQQDYLEYKTAANLWRSLNLRFGTGMAFYAKRLLLLYDQRLRIRRGLKDTPDLVPGKTREWSEWKRVEQMMTWYPPSWFADWLGNTRLVDAVLRILALMDKEDYLQQTAGVTFARQTAEGKRQIVYEPKVAKWKRPKRACRDEISDTADSKSVAESK